MFLLSQSNRHSGNTRSTSEEGYSESPATATLTRRTVSVFVAGDSGYFLPLRYGKFRNDGLLEGFGTRFVVKNRKITSKEQTMVRGGCVYIMTNRHRTVYYIGVTANLPARIYQHRNGNGSRFTKKYQCTDLLYYEPFGRIEEAIAREKALKTWRRAWKEALIKTTNPSMKDLWEEITEW